MFKKFLVLPLLLIVSISFAQSLKPIAQMVAQAKNGQTMRSVSIFNKQVDRASEGSELTKALSNWTLLAWDDTKMQEMRSFSSNPVSLTLPWENGSTITLDLVPAKNLSDDFQVHTATSKGAAYETERGVHYWGIVSGDPSSMAAISLFNGELIGSVEYRGTRFTIGALPSNPEKTHILYNEADLKADSPFNCFTDDDLHKIGDDAGAQNRSSSPDNCVRVYLETDYTVFQNKGSVTNVVNYMTGVFNQVSALYTNESVNLVLHDIKVWNIVDPYPGPSASNYLAQFKTAMNGNFNGDIAHLVGIHSLGGVAYVDILCNKPFAVGYSSINATYSNVPTYSWTIEVLTHEIGHNLGSSHTHACAWNGNNTAIDGCGPAAGSNEGCNAPIPASGTIMSYCHLLQGVGINFNNGFGPQPGDRIRSELYNASCLAACGGGGGGDECSYGPINTNNFEANFGIWLDGGIDCNRTNNALYANSPVYSIAIQDNTFESVMTTGNQNWTTYDELTVDFSYVAISMEFGEDFWLQISTNGGASYSTVADYNSGTQFTNAVRKSGHVIIPGPFTTNTRLRFRNDASDDTDKIYIDDVVITGCKQPSLQGDNGDRNIGDNFEESVETPGIANFVVGPNPATDQINVQFDVTGTLEATLMLRDLTGRVVWQMTEPASQGQRQIMVPVNHLTNGMYILSLKAGEEFATVKVVLAR